MSDESKMPDELIAWPSYVTPAGEKAITGSWGMRRHYSEEARSYVRADLVEGVAEVLSEAAEYFDNRSDADHDETGFVPNAEMRLLSAARAALSKLKEAGL